eukprot:COSAG06_NODE_30311_length_541_cov_0.728507_1_plen_34_part_10
MIPYSRLSEVMQVVMLHSQVFEVTQVALPLRRKW